MEVPAPAGRPEVTMIRIPSREGAGMEFVQENLNYILVAAGVVVALYAVRVMREYERAVVFHLGRFMAVRGPGLILLVQSFSKWCGLTCVPESSTCPRRT